MNLLVAGLFIWLAQRTGVGRPGVLACWAWVMMACIGSPAAHAQCTIDGPADIPDPGILSIEIPVGGLTDDLLSGPTQGICSVQIAFQHEYLGDLTMFLQAPDGTRVQLIGPSTTATLGTNLTSWNVSFVPCGQAPIPDPGFSAVWSNLQAWQSLAFYTGSYHPYDGCLEDFNSGSANGTWLLIVEDEAEFQFGSILSVTLTFCNPDGLDCTPCFADGGTLSPTDVILCEGESFDSQGISVDFGGPAPPSSIHAYAFLLIREGLIVQHGMTPVFQPPIGTYSICGLSYGTEDAALVDALLATGDSALVTDALIAGLFCGSGSSNCMVLEVLDAPDSLFAEARICAGETFTFRGVSYAMPGIYYQSLDGPGACDTIARIDIGMRSLDVIGGYSGELGCGQQVLAGATASGSSSAYSFLWSTGTGLILSDPAMDTIDVGLPGVYSVSVTDGICSGMTTVIVPEGPGYPSIVAQGGTIDCRNPEVLVDPVFVPSDAMIAWTGPNGFMAPQAAVTLTEAGVYIVYAENSAGCISSDTIDILVDTIRPPVMISQLDKDCVNGEVLLAYQAGPALDSVRWNGPGMFTSVDDTIVVVTGGPYDLQVFYSNGCIGLASWIVDGDFSLPDIGVFPDTDTINCGETIDLAATSMTPGVVLSWTGPQGQSVAGPGITATQPGLYVAGALSPNGCIATDTVALFEGSDLFDFQWVRDTLDCRKDTATIGVLSPVADLFHWIGFPGSDSLQPFIQVTQPGLYTVSMTDTLTGCEVIASLMVMEDRAPPTFGIQLDTITCLDAVADFLWLAGPGQSYDTVFWVLPDLTVVGGEELSTAEPGQYELISLGANGCPHSIPFEVPFDTLGPGLLAEAGILGCLDTLSLVALTLDSVINWGWGGPGVLSTNGPAAEVVLPGVYQVMATGPNGCITTLPIPVDSNFTLPTLALTWDTLTCLGPSALVASTLDAGVAFTWFDAGGMVIGDRDTLWTSLPGTYVAVAEGMNGCRSRDSLILSPGVGPAVIVMGDTFTCVRTMVGLSANVGPGLESIAWLNLAGDTVSTQPAWTTSLAGPLVWIATGTNGCVSKDTIDIPFDTVAPMIIIQQVGEIQCDRRDVMLDASGSIPVGGIFQWSTSDGLILGPSDEAVIDIRDTGSFSLVLTDPSNGCADTAGWTAIALPGVFGQAELTWTQPGCAGDANGSIEVTSVSGAVPPLAYSLNGGTEQGAGFFEGLAAGDYWVTIRDISGCRLDTLVTLQGTPSFTVNAGEDIEIYLGQALTLTGTTDLAGVLIAQNAWSDYFQLLCLCDDIEISPSETADFIFQVSSNTGCTRADTVRVYVIEEPNFFVPDIFSPNGDGINDEIRPVIASGVSRVRQWVVFDRWGDAMYGHRDFQPNDPVVLWDGRDPDGRRLNPAVFAYLIELELTNGEIRTRYGSITLVR